MGQTYDDRRTTPLLKVSYLFISGGPPNKSANVSETVRGDKESRYVEPLSRSNTTTRDTRRSQIFPPAFSSLVCYSVHVVCFYRAMHFSAKRGIAIACRLSVCPSVYDVGRL